MTEEQQMWNDEQIQGRIDALTPIGADMGEIEYWNTLRDIALRVGVEIRDDLISINVLLAQENEMLFLRGARRLDELKRVQSALAAAHNEARQDLEELASAAQARIVELEQRIAELEAQNARFVGRIAELVAAVGLLEEAVGDENQN